MVSALGYKANLLIIFITNHLVNYAVFLVNAT